MPSGDNLAITSLSICPSGVTAAELSKIPGPISAFAAPATAAEKATARINDLLIVVSVRAYRTSNLYQNRIHSASLRLKGHRTEFESPGMTGREGRNSAVRRKENTMRIPREYEGNTKRIRAHIPCSRLASGLWVAWKWLLRGGSEAGAEGGGQNGRGN